MRFRRRTVIREPAHDGGPPAGLAAGQTQPAMITKLAGISRGLHDRYDDPPPAPDHLNPLDPRFPIQLGPWCPEFWRALRLWEAYPSQNARAFAADERAAAVQQNACPVEAFTQAVPPLPVPVPYPALEEDTLAGEFEPLELLP